MKMKELSELTGLSDRTIRFYISDGIFVPENYTENHQGRRNFDFTDRDVATLNKIAILRKYNFSLDEISNILMPEGDVQIIVEKHIEDLKKQCKQELQAIDKLIDSLKASPWSDDELCDFLLTSELKTKKQTDDSTEQDRKIKKKKSEFIFSIVAFFTVIIFTILSVPFTKTGIMNEPLIYLFFGIIGTNGYFVLKYVFRYFSQKHHYAFYVLIVCIIWVLGYINGKYI